MTSTLKGFILDDYETFQLFCIILKDCMCRVCHFPFCLSKCVASSTDTIKTSTCCTTHMLCLVPPHLQVSLLLLASIQIAALGCRGGTGIK